MPSPASCFSCMEDGPVGPPTTAPRPAPAPDGPVIRARYDTQCRSCNTGIHVGERIVRTTHGTYVHAHHFDLDGWGVDA